MTNTHVPVLLQEAIEQLQPQVGNWYLDATFGRGGHTQALLNLQAKVIAFDCDATAIEYGQTQFAKAIADNQLLLIRNNFDRLEQEVERLRREGKLTEISGVLFDFGTSSPQLEDEERGFSFQHDAELDMRMDDRLGVKAKDLLALLSERQLADIFFEFGGEREARKIARAIVLIRAEQPIERVSELGDLIQRVKREKRGYLNPATKVFQALRIVVNGELESITTALPQALHVLKPGGRIVTISFHEGEDRIVKTDFRDWEKRQFGQNKTKNVIVPTDAETELNNRARSAKMRVFEKAQ